MTSARAVEDEDIQSVDWIDEIDGAILSGSRET